MSRGYRNYRTPARRRNGGGIVPYKPTAAEAKAVQALSREYTDYHWGLPSTKVFKINDPLIPHITAMGPLEELHFTDGENVAFPKGCWVAWDPKHKRKRLYLPLTAETKGMFRAFMKHAGKTEKLQAIAQRAGGKQAKHKLPNLKARDLGTVQAIVYWAQKGGEADEVAGTSYIHDFGEDGMGGHKPRLAVDVSGRIWLCGGDYTTAEAGITG